MQALTLGCINLDLLVCFCGGRGWKQLYSLAALSALSFPPGSVQRQNVLNCMIIGRQNAPSRTLAQLILITD